GLLPDFVGRGLGKYFLVEMLNFAWLHNPSRVWLHTDSDDHPNAIKTYKNAGFSIFRQQFEEI
ncbi:MAG: GNAT family N-acetyltransferase, partial [Terriglobales bacterium]